MRIARKGLLLGSAPLLAVLASWPAGADLRDEVSVSRTIPPAQHLVFRIDPVAGTIAFEDPTMRELSADQQAAVAAVPAWLAPDLAAAFYRLRSIDDPDGLARLILDAEDPAYVDEIGFLVAHLSGEDLHRMDRGIIPETARRIYEVADRIGFAELVERGAADDPERYTTVSYRVLRDGAPDSFELPRDVYYWDVVHPSLDGEDLVTIDPARHRVADPPEGWHWRSYLWSDDPERSYQAASVLVRPTRITDATFAAWSLAGAPRATSHFAGVEVGPLELVRADSGEPVTIAFTRGDQRCGGNDYPNPDGMYFATLTPVELAAAAGRPEFLRNLVQAGGGNADLLPSDIAVWDSMTLSSRRILVVRDRLPFDLAEDPTEAALTLFGRAYDVIGSDELDALVLSTDAAPFLNTDYNKIIVPSDQPRALYEALVRNTDKLERFVDYGGTLELHGATRAVDDWSDLRLPGGVRCAPQDGSNAHDMLVPYGYPLLSDVVPQADYLWDFEDHMGLPGDRQLAPTDTALERLGWWVSQNLTWNIQEKLCWKRGSVPSRFLEPQEIVYDHFGNCGELQDMWTSAGRSLLIAVWNVGTLADDHVWNEFWQGDQWYPLQVDWSDNDTRIGNWGQGADADLNESHSGKTISAMDGWRGDGLLRAALGRYPRCEVDGHTWCDYSDHVTLSLTVTDAAGDPVDGAQVLLATTGFYDPSTLQVAGWRFTGPDGVATFVVGEDNDYAYQVLSAVGDYPDATHVATWVSAAEALPDASFDETVVLDGLLAPPASTTVAAAGPSRGRVVAHVAVSGELVRMANRDDGLRGLIRNTAVERYASGDAQLLLMTAAEYDDYFAGLPFETLADARRGRDLDLDETLAGDGPFVLVVGNNARVAAEQEVTIGVELYDPAGGGDVDGDDGEAGAEIVDDVAAADGTDDAEDDGGILDVETGGGGCGCRAGGTFGGAAWLLVLLVPAAAALRRRRP